MAHSPLDGLGPMVSPRRKRKVSDIASQLQAQRLSMGEIGGTPESPTPVCEAPGRKKRAEVTSPVRKTILTITNFHGAHGKLKSEDWDAAIAELKASKIGSSLANVKKIQCIY